MRITSIWILMMLIAFASGIWFGYQWRNPPIQWDMPMFVTCGGGEYPKEAFRKVNDELDEEIASLLGSEASRDVFAAVVPELSGYRIRIAGRSNSELLKEPMRSQLSDWVHQRMEQLLRDELSAEAGGLEESSAVPHSEAGQ